MNQIFQEQINSIITEIILPRQLQIQLLKFYSKDLSKTFLSFLRNFK